MKNLSGESVLVVLLLATSIALATIAFYSPKPSPPLSSAGSCTAPLSQNGDPVMSSRTASGCAAAVIAYDFALRSYYSSFWTLPEIFQSLFFMALLCLVLPRVRAPDSLKKRIALPEPLILVLMLIGVVCFGVFVYGETVNILYANSASSYSEGNLTYLHYFSIDPQLPIHAVLGLVVASACFGILRTKKGLSEGVRSGVVFCSFWIAVAQTCLLIFDYKEMYLQVTDFTSTWTLFGFPILSNWFVLTVALSLAVLGVLPSKRNPGDQGSAATRVRHVGRAVCNRPLVRKRTPSLSALGSFAIYPEDGGATLLYTAAPRG